MTIDKKSSKMAFVCDVCSARFEAEEMDQQPAADLSRPIATKSPPLLGFF
jgi:transcription elongation factor Elf1